MMAARKPAVWKAGALKAAATRTCADYAGALRLLRKRPQDPEDFPKALMVSALEEAGVGAAWDEMQALLFSQGDPTND